MHQERTKVIVVGGGYSGLQAALELDRRGYVCTLVDRNRHHDLLPELPHRISDNELSTRVCFRELLEHGHVSFVQGSLTHVNYQDRKLSLQTGEELQFDKLILALGAQTNYYGIPGLPEHSFSFISSDDVDRLLAKIEDNFSRASKLPQDSDEYAKLMTYVVGGGGLTGVEIVGELIYRLPKIAREYGLGPDKITIYLVEACPTLLPAAEETIRAQTTEHYGNSRHVRLILDTPIREAHPQRVILGNDRVIDAETVIWTGGVRANAFFEAPYVDRQGQEARWPLGRGKRLEVDELYRVQGVPDTYAIGDNALIYDRSTGQPFVQNGQAASKQGELVVDYLTADLAGEQVSPKDIELSGVLISLGPYLGTGTLYQPCKVNLPISIFSRKLKKIVEWRYKTMDIR